MFGVFLSNLSKQKQQDSCPLSLAAHFVTHNPVFYEDLKLDVHTLLWNSVSLEPFISTDTREVGYVP